MGFDIQFAPRVLQDDFPELPGEVIDDLLGDPEDPSDEGKVGALAVNPAIGRPLSGSLKGFWRLPLCGRYRVIYSVLVRENLVGVLMVGIRREASPSDVYRRLTALLKKATAEELLNLPPRTRTRKRPEPAEGTKTARSRG